MPPSLSALERASPPSRRRSCLACTTAKRRCDTCLPSCLRCSRRGIACLYPVRQPGGSAGGPVRSTAAATVASAGQQAYSFLPALPCDLVLDSASPSAPPPPASLQTTWEQLPLPPTPGFIDGSYTAAAAAAAAGPAPIVPAATFCNDGPNCVVAVRSASALTAPPPEHWDTINRIITLRLRCAIDIIQDAPRRLVQENGLPWSHPLLYRDGMPRCMEDAYAACALYLAKNRVNAPVILRCIGNRLGELVAAGERDSGSGSATPLEHLARTQALLLYNIISVFDGDAHAQRSTTIERTISALLASAQRLLPFAGFEALGDSSNSAGPAGGSFVGSTAALSLCPVDTTREFWTSWVFMESARRTFMMARYFLHLYAIVAGVPPQTCNEHKFNGRYWTVSAALWHAANPVDFALAWQANRHFLAHVGSFAQLLAHGRAEDIDDFSRVFLTSMMGIDEFNGWMVTRRGGV